MFKFLRYAFRFRVQRLKVQGFRVLGFRVSDLGRRLGVPGSFLFRFRV